MNNSLMPFTVAGLIATATAASAQEPAAIPDIAQALLDAAYDHFGVFPTLLERDFNLPPVAELALEVERIASAQKSAASAAASARAHG